MKYALGAQRSIPTLGGIISLMRFNPSPDAKVDYWLVELISRERAWPASKKLAHRS